MAIHEQTNETPFASGLGICQDRDGREIAVAVLKATFLFDAGGRVQPAPADEQLPVFLADEHHGDRATTSLRYASDMVPAKRGTDVALLGHAYGHGKKSVEAGFRIGSVAKLLLVSGPRVWVSGPAGLGFVPAGWQGRARFAGTFDAAWERSRRPLFPEDLDERFYNAVPQDQVLQPKLRGGERVLLRYMHPKAEMLVLEVPRCAFSASFHARDRVEKIPMVADTLLIEPDMGRLALSFRASYSLGEDAMRLWNVVFCTSHEQARERVGRVDAPDRLGEELGHR